MNNSSTSNIYLCFDNMNNIFIINQIGNHSSMFLIKQIHNFYSTS